jgi:uncharacterized membrane protein YccF (DUF307 family)
VDEAGLDWKVSALIIFHLIGAQPMAKSPSWHHELSLVPTGPNVLHYPHLKNAVDEHADGNKNGMPVSPVFS